MNAETLEALRKSIAKWEGIVAGTTGDEGTENCALCERFYYQSCIGCPVWEFTTYGQCRNTPYDDWCELGPDHVQCKKISGRIALASFVKSEHSIAIAKKELEFLKSLLPKEV